MHARRVRCLRVVARTAPRIDWVWEVGRAGGGGAQAEGPERLRSSDLNPAARHAGPTTKGNGCLCHLGLLGLRGAANGGTRVCRQAPPRVKAAGCNLRYGRCVNAPAIVWVDESLVVVDKAAGQLAVPGRGDDKRDCTWPRVRALFADALVVHRLDQATSGLLLFARGAAAQRRMSCAFAERQVTKRYVAVAAGLVADDAGRIELALAADWPRRPRQQVHGAGKAAVTLWRVLQRDRTTRRSRLELSPLTGRTHQLRVHLAAIGHPIIGDTLYAGDAGGERLLLHACMLEFVHPLNARPMQLHSAPPF